MAFDWTTVEGYQENMTAEEMVALLDNANFPSPDKTNWKAQFDRVSAEYGRFKKTNAGAAQRATEAESRANVAEQNVREGLAQIEELTKRIAELERDKTLSSYKASLLAQGYSEELAAQAATALVDGNMASFFESMTKNREATVRDTRAQLLADTPRPPASADLKPELSEAEMFAKKLAQQRISANKAAEDALAHYM